MTGYKPAPFQARMGQTPRTMSVPIPMPALPPTIDPVYSSFEGVPGFLETILVLTVSSAAAWAGIRTGMSKGNGRYLRAAGWVGGVGSALFGLLYLGGKSGLNQAVSLPAVRVTPS